MKTLLIIPILLFSLLTTAIQAANLLEVYNYAVTSDPTSVAAQIRVLIAQEQQQQSEATLYPQASLSGSLSENYLDGKGIKGSDYVGSSLRISVSQVLLDIASYRENERWKLLTEKSSAEYLQAQSELMVKVVERYFDVLIAIDYVDLLKQNKITIQENLKRLNALYKKQLVAITGVYEAQARLDLAHSEEIEADVKLSVAYERLYEVIGERVSDLSQLKGNIHFTVPKDNIKQWIELAMQNNASILAVKQHVLAARKEISFRKAGFYPTVALSFNQSRQDIGFDNAPRPETDTSTLSINIQQALYQGGGISAKKRESLHKLELAKLAEIETVRKTEQQLREYYLSLKSDVLKIKATQRQIESETKRTESMKASFKYGTVTVNDVLNADADFYKAQAEHQKAKYNYIKNQFNLKNSAGVLTEKDILEVNNWLINK
jgi:outer membrane protein